MSKRIEVMVPDELYAELVKHSRAQDRFLGSIAVEALEQYNVAATQPRPGPSDHTAATYEQGWKTGYSAGAAGDPPPRAIKSVKVEFADESAQSFTHVDAVSTRQREMVTLYGDEGPDILLPALGVRWIEVES